MVTNSKGIRRKLRGKITELKDIYLGEKKRRGKKSSYE
ncbi:unnamed protein product [Brassica rapa subsp. trilocularis]